MRIAELILGASCRYEPVELVAVGLSNAIDVRDCNRMHVWRGMPYIPLESDYDRHFDRHWQVIVGVVCGSV